MSITKNGFPWVGIYDLNITASPCLMNMLIDNFNSTDWGNEFENYRRLKQQTAIYSGTRVKHYSFSLDNDPTLKPIFDRAMFELKFGLRTPMNPSYGEITLMVPNGKIWWHYDHQLQCRYSSRIMLPFLNNDDVDYYFANWKENTPEDKVPRPNTPFIDYSSVKKYKLKTGRFYVFNHRVPHFTQNNLNIPRGMLSINLVPEYAKNFITRENFKQDSPPQPFEKTELEPSIIL